MSSRSSSSHSCFQPKHTCTQTQANHLIFKFRKTHPLPLLKTLSQILQTIKIIGSKNTRTILISHKNSQPFPHNSHKRIGKHSSHSQLHTNLLLLGTKPSTHESTFAPTSGFHFTSS
jgi:hypothetical protein